MKKSLFLTLVLIVGCVIATNPHVAQENPGYTRAEYDAFQKAVEVADLGAKATALKKFVDANPKSKLVPYANEQFGPVLQGLYQKRDMATLGRVAEQFLQLMPPRPEICPRNACGALDEHGGSTPKILKYQTHDHPAQPAQR